MYITNAGWDATYPAEDVETSEVDECILREEDNYGRPRRCTCGALAAQESHLEDPRGWGDGTLIATVRVNQEQGSLPFSWQTLGTFALPTGRLRVTLADDADGYVIADAIRVEKVG